MNNIGKTLVISFALFSLFFGAGNLVLPPQLGFNFGKLWWLATIGFCISAVVIPILAIMAHAKLQGSIFDFGKKVSPTFSVVYSLIVYAISISLPSPRTASVTHEIAIQPFFNTPPLFTSIIYFMLVFIFVMNRSKILDILGKILTPAIISILFLIIGITLFYNNHIFEETTLKNTFTTAILEGYQTFDAIGAIVVGGVLIVSINLKGISSYNEKKTLIRNAGLFAGLSLFLIYAGLIVTGALQRNNFDADISRTDLLNGISTATLGSNANLLLGILVSLACFTTAVGIVTGTADFIKSRFANSQKAYTITAIVGVFLGVLIGQFNVDYIITVAIPTLMFIYPVSIVLILLNITPDKYASPTVFKAVVFSCIVFSIPDFTASISSPAPKEGVFDWIPLNEYGMGWVLPCIGTFVVANLVIKPKATV